MVAIGDLETPKSTVEIKVEVGDIQFHEIFIVMAKLYSPIIGLMFLQRKHTVLDMRQGFLNFPCFSETENGGPQVLKRHGTSA